MANNFEVLSAFLKVTFHHWSQVFARFKSIFYLILIFFPTDEKERFDPTQFQESIVQGLNQTGTDLEAVAKFLDSSGAKLDYRRYAETLFDILVAGGMLGESPCKTYNVLHI